MKFLNITIFSLSIIVFSLSILILFSGIQSQIFNWILTLSLLIIASAGTGICKLFKEKREDKNKL